MIEAIAQVKWAGQDFAEARYSEAAERLRKAIPALDGQWLGRALLMLGDSIYRQPQAGLLFDVEKAHQQAAEALEVLTRAQELLTAYGDAQSAQYCAGLIATIKRDRGT